MQDKNISIIQKIDATKYCRLLWNINVIKTCVIIWNTEICLNWILKKLESCVNSTLNKKFQYTKSLLI